MMYLNQFIVKLNQTKKKTLAKSSVWIIISVVDHTINNLKCNVLAGSSYIKLPNELGHPKKGLINIQSFDDNQCFQCLNILRNV